MFHDNYRNVTPDEVVAVIPVDPEPVRLLKPVRIEKDGIALYITQDSPDDITLVFGPEGYSPTRVASLVKISRAALDLFADALFRASENAARPEDNAS